MTRGFLLEPNSCPAGRTFFTGEVGVVTWLVGLVGGDAGALAGGGVVLLLTDAEVLLLSGGIGARWGEGV